MEKYHDIKLLVKKDCEACDIIEYTLFRFHVEYEKVEADVSPSPQLQIDGHIYKPPFTGSLVKRLLIQNNVNLS